MSFTALSALKVVDSCRILNNVVSKSKLTFRISNNVSFTSLAALKVVDSCRILNNEVSKSKLTFRISNNMSFTALAARHPIHTGVFGWCSTNGGVF